MASDRNCADLQHTQRAVFKETVGCHLVSVHNIRHQLRLMEDVREAIDSGKVQEFLHLFLRESFPSEPIPQWVQDAVEFLGYTLPS